MVTARLAIPGDSKSSCARARMLEHARSLCVNSSTYLREGIVGVRSSMTPPPVASNRRHHRCQRACVLDSLRLLFCTVARSMCLPESGKRVAPLLKASAAVDDHVLSKGYGAMSITTRYIGRVYDSRRHRQKVQHRGARPPPHGEERAEPCSPPWLAGGDLRGCRPGLRKF